MDPIRRTPENKKKQYARKQMETAFFDLLRKKRLEEISVTSLCERAGVNRSTFYAHYLDIYDMMEKVTDNFADRLFLDITKDLGEPAEAKKRTSSSGLAGHGYIQNNPASSDSGRANTTAYELVLHALEITLTNRENCRLLLKAGSNLMDRMIDNAVIWCGERYVQYSGKKDSSYRAYYTMMIGGTIVLWYDWIRSGFTVSKEDLAKVITDYVIQNIAAIWA